MYRFDNIDVEDYPVDVKDKQSRAVRIRRTLTFTSKQGRKNVAFRVAASEKIVAEGNRTFRIGDSLRIRITGDHKGRIVDTLTGKQLRVPMDVAKGESSLVLEYSW